MTLKIRGKLFLSFLVLCFFSLLFTLVSIWIYNKKDKISEQLKLLDEIHLLAMEEYKIQQEFLLMETRNAGFFKTRQSAKLDNHREIYNQMVEKLHLLNDDEDAKKIFSPHFIQNVLLELNNYRHIFKEVVTEVLSRGFKDFGMEGEMRNYAHALMKIKELNQVDILMLRRHEKDFIIRKEEQYAEQFKTVINNVKSEVKQSEKLTAIQKMKIDSMLNGYLSNFSRLVSSELGKSSQLFQLANQYNVMISQIRSERKRAMITEKAMYQDLLMIALITMLFIFALTFFLSYKLASELTKPLMNLNNGINLYVESKFSVSPTLQKRNSQDEISVLSNNFNKMADEITSHIKFFEEKVKERTAEIHKQNSEILAQKIQIREQRDQLMVKTQDLEIHQRVLTEKNKNIVDSIRYAQRIQQSIMPSIKAFKKALPESFIYFKPLDIVSGDFYFLHQKGNKIFFAVADCTGHGVPGAFVSIIGIHAINRALNEFNLEEPSKILDKVNELVDQNINNHTDLKINDGMDIALCCLDIQTKKLEYAGANIPIWIINAVPEEETPVEYEESEIAVGTKTAGAWRLKEIKANKQPIGHFQDRIPFTNHTVEIAPGDMLYIFSDGYADQFGGPDGKKFKYERLKTLLLSIQQNTLDNQKKMIREAFKNWKGNYDQVDDICVLGVRI